MNTIHNAIERRNYLQFDILVNQRIGLNRSDGKGLTPLMKSCHEPNRKNATEMVRLLLRQQADTKKLDKKGRNVLMHAALTGVSSAVKLLLDDSYFDPAGRDHQGNAPIHYGAMSGDLPTLVMLWEHLQKFRVKADLRNDQGLTPIHVSSSQGHIKAARFLHSEAGSSLVLRDGTSNRTARDWIDEVCDMPLYTDPFSLNTDISLIAPKIEIVDEEYVDKSEIRLFVFMKEAPEIDIEEINIRPPWDISTNVRTPPKYLKNGKLNPGRSRPFSAAGYPCKHYSGVEKMRPFSAPCGYPEFLSWKHPHDMQKYLSVKDLQSLRRYESLTDLKKGETNLKVRQHGEKLLARPVQEGSRLR